jgi:hypothetical protein
MESHGSRDGGGGNDGHGHGDHDGESCRYYARAVAIWPRLDRRALSQCSCDPYRVARIVARRTSLPIEEIVELLVSASIS